MIKLNQDNLAEIKKTNLIKKINKSIKIAVMDDKGLYDYQYNYIKTPLELKYKQQSHGAPVCNVLYELAQDFLPNLEIYYFNKTNEAKDYIIKNNIPIVCCSFYNGVKSQMLEELKEHTLLVCSSGNSADSYNGADNHYPAAYNDTLSVGAYIEEIDKPASYSDGGSTLDLVGFTNIYVKNSKLEYFPFSGTSAAAPYISFMLIYSIAASLVSSNKQDLINFALNNCIDVHTLGIDNKTGRGLFKLPDLPEKKELDFIYQSDGTYKVFVDDNEINFNGNPPQFINSKLLMPLREILEELGHTVNWYNDTKNAKVIE